MDKKIRKQQLNKLDHLISNGEKQVQFQNTIFDLIDRKVLWIFTFISASEIFLLKSYFLPNEIDIFSTDSFLLILILILGVIMLCYIIQTVKGKTFEI